MSRRHARLGPARSIRRRAMQVVMTTTLVALLLSAATLLLYELRTHRATWHQDLQTQVELVAQASATALNFDDPRVAAENLALLRLRPQIEAAAIYDARGVLFGAYTAPGQPPLPAALAPPPADRDFEGERIEIHRPVTLQGETVGTMVARAHYDVFPRLLGYLTILAGVTAASLLLAALVARRLQSTITDPIVAVSDVARSVMQQRDYTLRAPRTTDDEVGTLVDAFNAMLGDLGAQAAALRAADRRKDEFLATLAHELRNPLAPVSTALEILAAGGTDAATQARLVAMMQRQMKQFVRLIDDLMELSRITTGRLNLRPERLDLVDVLRAAVESITPALLERRHALAVVWPAPLWVQGDRTRLGQVFANLLGNAAKYTEPGGRIELRFDTTDPAWVDVCVSDNGIGIAPEMQDEVFEMFVQVDRTLARGRTGLGVGLALSRQLVEMHGGTLKLESAGLGQGSAFTVRLPRVAAAPEPARPDPAIAAPVATAAATIASSAAAAPAAPAAAPGAAIAVTTAELPAPAPAAAAPGPAARPLDARPDAVPSTLTSAALPALAETPTPIASPAPPSPAATRPTAPGSDAASRAPRSVLVADDNGDFADSLAAVLQSAGHDVRVTYDGEAALQSATGRLPDVGLFDIGMPGIDGYALAGAVRQLPGGDRCLLVAITGWGQHADQERARAAGFDRHLVKPVDLDALLALLSRPG